MSPGILVWKAVMEGVATGGAVDRVAAVGVHGFDDPQEHPNTKCVEVASKENRRSKEGHKI